MIALHPSQHPSALLLQCCTDGGKVSDSIFTPILAALGIDVLADVIVGTGCADVPVVGVSSGADCNAFAYCCEDNSQSLISVSCVLVIPDL
ncbi:hypothetical protein DL96DRAFT_1720780 [Flagelloscypha sp. PMI_526]|nr:hypothetical protein DL96DRAFT_1720780 [Flagelloscypha sp. PMI_526]